MSFDREDAISVVKGCFAAIAKQDVEALAAHYTEDYVLELPYALPDAPVVHEGREVVRAYLNEVVGALQITLSLTGDHWLPESSLLIAEYVSSGRYADTGEPYANRYVGYWNFRDGRVCRLREYYNPEAIRPSPSDPGD